MVVEEVPSQSQDDLSLIEEDDKGKGLSKADRNKQLFKQLFEVIDETMKVDVSIKCFYVSMFLCLFPFHVHRITLQLL